MICNVRIADADAVEEKFGEAAHVISTLRAILADRERELLELKGPCFTRRCRLHYAHSGPCDIERDSMTATRFRIRPFDVDAIQWTGRDCCFTEERIQSLVGPDTFEYVVEEDRANSDDPDASAALRDHDHGVWRPVKDGTWIVRRCDTGRVFRLADDAFRAAYEPLPYVVDEAGVHIYEEAP
jgi:hypothetical protein